jgi:hypothetical protein
MRNLILMTSILVLLGCSPSLAQQMRVPTPRNPAATGMAAIGLSMPSPTGVVGGTRPALGSPVPGTIPTPTAGLGSIPPMTGTAATIARGPMGAITTCAAAPGFTLDASTALISGALATPPLPGATIPPNPAFGSSLATGSCNPATGTQDALEAFGVAAVVAPIPGLATISGPTYGDATVPMAMTEAGAPGLSPLIDVPSPSPCGPTTMMTTTVPMTDPTMAPSLTMPTTPSTMMTIPSSTLLASTPGTVITPGVSPGC